MPVSIYYHLKIAYLPSPRSKLKLQCWVTVLYVIFGRSNFFPDWSWIPRTSASNVSIHLCRCQSGPADSLRSGYETRTYQTSCPPTNTFSSTSTAFCARNASKSREKFFNSFFYRGARWLQMLPPPLLDAQNAYSVGN